MTDPLGRRAAFDALPDAAWAAVRADALAGRTLFLTGATGFVGGWLLGAIDRFNARQRAAGTRGLGVHALARTPPQTAAPWLSWVIGDVRRFRDDTPVQLIVHAALPSTATPPGGATSLRELAQRGALAASEHARRSGAARTLVLSSGAVYGSATAPLAESAPFAPLADDDAYGHAKREAEAIALEGVRDGHDVVIARLFTCIGEGYRSHSHLAHVSLVDDARAGWPLVLRSDGSAVRSYFYGADLGVWLLALLSADGSDTVNVGSDQAMSLLEFARLIAVASGRGGDAVKVKAVAPTVRPCFVPDISHARSKYGLTVWTRPEDAIRRLLASPTGSA